MTLVLVIGLGVRQVEGREREKERLTRLAPFLLWFALLLTSLLLSISTQFHTIKGRIILGLQEWWQQMPHTNTKISTQSTLTNTVHTNSIRCFRFYSKIKANVNQVQSIAAFIEVRNTQGMNNLRTFLCRG